MAPKVGDEVSARVEEQGSARWVCPPALTVDGVKVAVAQGRTAALRTTCPPGVRLTDPSLPPFGHLLKVHYANSEEAEFVSLSEPDENEVLRAELERLRRKAAVKNRVPQDEEDEDDEGDPDEDKGEDQPMALAQCIHREATGTALPGAARGSRDPAPPSKPGPAESEPLTSMGGRPRRHGTSTVKGAGAEAIPAVASTSAGPVDVATLIQLEWLKELHRGRDEYDSSFADVSIDGTRGLGRTLQRYRRLKRRAEEDPRKIITTYVARARDVIGVEEDQPWAMMDVNRRLSWGKYRALQRMHYVFEQVFQRLDQGEFSATQALCAQGMKRFGQAAVDQGSFEPAWLLTGEVRRGAGGVGDHRSVRQGVGRGRKAVKQGDNASGRRGGREAAKDENPWWQGRERRQGRRQGRLGQNSLYKPAPRGARQLHSYIEGLTTAATKMPLRRLVGLAAASNVAGPDTSRYHDLGGRPFPSLLPYLAGGLAPASARRRQRWAQHRRAERWTNALWSLFSFYEVASPCSPEKVRAAIAEGLPPCGGFAAARFAANLRTSILPWCRLAGDPTEGRGTRSMLEVLDRLVASTYILLGTEH